MAIGYSHYTKDCSDYFYAPVYNLRPDHILMEVALITLHSRAIMPECLREGIFGYCQPWCQGLECM